MNPLQRTLEYLNNRDTRNHLGAKLLFNEHWPEKAEQILAEAIQLLQREFTKTSTTASATCKLTAVSTLIGEMAAHHVGIYDRATKEGVPWWHIIKIGDLILESFLQCDYISIKYTHFDTEEKLFCYLVAWTRNWPGIKEINISQLVRGSVPYPPDPLSFKNPRTGLPTIKNLHSEDVFNKLTSKPFLKAGNKLQQVPWQINKRALETVNRYRNKILPEERHLNKLLSSNDLPKIATYKSKKTEFELITLKGSQLSLYPEFYQLIDYDYRGRIYYTEAFLNFQGSDYARGIMQFANGKKLDQSGMWWLAVHTASSYNKSYSIDRIPEWCEGDYKSYLEAEELESISVDKMTLEDRVRWTNENMDLIIECAKRNRLCLESAEKPVSFLACCYEWEAIDKDRNHICHIPLPIDGSNNGWQHLGAISKDTNTGKLVGLIPVEIQNDFYVQTAKELIKLMPEWFEKRNMPMKHIRKGISKRGSMTRAYSAGADKIAINMYEDCRAEGFHNKYNITMEDCKLLATNLIKAINTVCAGPLDTMRFLQKIANKKLEDANQIFWWSPSGFPVRYQAFQTVKMKAKSTLLGLGKSRDQVKHTHLVIRRRQEDNKPIADKQKYASGISPNFIHSMDASHMALVIYDWDKDFGAVHDSFSTHPNDVEELLALTKDKFVKMYNYENYFNKIEGTLKVTMPEQPALGELNITEVYDSDYFFA